MGVRVRMFAAVREASGTSETWLPPGPLPVLLDTLRDRYGEPFTSRLALAAVLVDGTGVDPAAPVEVPDGAEVALLPPVSGGAVASRRRAGGSQRRDLAAAVVPAATLLLAAAALAAGPLASALLAVVLAAAGLLAVTALLAGHAARPVLPAAAVAGLGLPIAAVFEPAAAWERLPAYAAGTLLAAFALPLLTGRRRQLSATVAATCLAGLFSGAGAAGLIALRLLPEGFSWALALVLLVGVPELAAAVVGLLAPTVSPQAVRILALGVVAGGVAALLSPPLALVTTLGLAAAGAAGGTGVLLLSEALAERPPGARGRGRRSARHPRPATVLGSVGGLLLAAPLAYLVARAAAL